MIVNHYIRSSLLVPIFLAILILPNVPLKSYVHWHDSQRLGQILLIVYSIFGGCFLKYFTVKKYIFIYFLIFIALGIFSSFLSDFPLWSLTELSIFVGGYALGFFIYRKFDESYEAMESYSLFIFFLTASLLALYFFIAYTTSFFIGGQMDTWEFLNGFSNPRFFGQFLTLLLPVLFAPILQGNKWRKYFFVLSLIVCFMLIASGTRGAFLGLGAVALIYLWLSKMSRKWTILFIKITCVALVMHYILMEVIPDFFQMNVRNEAFDRKLFGLSAREVLWGKAIAMVNERPFFGFGPMHFANMKSVIANHPHQLFLQILSEWGILFFLVFFYCLIKIIYAILIELIFPNKIKNEKTKIIFMCLSASVFSSLIQSMVDGVFVMPYTEVIFVFMAAWLAAVYYSEKNEPVFEAHCVSSIKSWIINLIFIVAAIILLFSFFEKSPTYIGKSHDNYYKNEGFLKPRFWINGGF